MAEPVPMVDVRVLEFEQRRTVFQSEQYLHFIAAFKSRLASPGSMKAFFQDDDMENVLSHFELV